MYRSDIRLREIRLPSNNITCLRSRGIGFDYLETEKNWCSHLALLMRAVNPKTEMNI